MVNDNVWTKCLLLYNVWTTWLLSMIMYGPKIKSEIYSTQPCNTIAHLIVFNSKNTINTSLLHLQFLKKKAL